MTAQYILSVNTPVQRMSNSEANKGQISHYATIRAVSSRSLLNGGR